MTGVQLRRLRSSESGLHRKIRLRALRDAPDAFGDTFAEAAARGTAYWDDLTRSVTDPGRHAMFLACDADEVVGSVYGLLDADRSNGARVGGMWVTPEWRGRGVGRTLLRAVVDWAREQGRSRLSLWAPAHSAAALALYGHAGFRETGGRRARPSDSAKEIVEMEARP